MATLLEIAEKGLLEAFARQQLAPSLLTSREDRNLNEVDADAMADLLRGDHAHVNLIPMNPVAHTPWQASPMPVIDAFADTLRAAGIETTIRHNRGQEIGAACGQLAAERAGEPSAPAVARRRARLESASAAALLATQLSGRPVAPEPAGQEEQLAVYERTNPVAGAGWVREHLPRRPAGGNGSHFADDRPTTGRLARGRGGFVRCR